MSIAVGNNGILRSTYSSSGGDEVIKEKISTIEGRIESLVHISIHFHSV